MLIDGILGAREILLIVYKFVYDKSNRRFKGTIHEFVKNRNWEPYIILTGRKKTAKGWSLEQSHC